MHVVGSLPRNIKTQVKMRILEVPHIISLALIVHLVEHILGRDERTDRNRLRALINSKISYGRDT